MSLRRVDEIDHDVSLLADNVRPRTTDLLMLARTAPLVPLRHRETVTRIVLAAVVLGRKPSSVRRLAEVVGISIARLRDLLGRRLQRWHYRRFGL